MEEVRRPISEIMDSAEQRVLGRFFISDTVMTYDLIENCVIVVTECPAKRGPVTEAVHVKRVGKHSKRLRGLV